ncbi:hypothetical protein ACR8AL_14260 [Clavibacter sepedonicus]|uniref:Membrane protein n=1 Tax=Clavibacter sepedonicus TaxID=31964 RepID=B0RJA1_CLASE|nr:MULTISPECIES: hypothetical protein [Clavibacter]MBD5383124.1 hypothetical protein [Clavibacter sp.]OQJ45240.1 hypothetical protein B5P19_15345 [Clavibacter sepedonicus]OQJ50875.1 hypothetical protein B5P20_15680 [Clavibacter sepedonicus]UUK67326.1 hypothetical protein LRE50_16335 [Clavibacter sepedonicus]CAQ03291.1 putative membrane protein [Clavibacter sepedonicus]
MTALPYRQARPADAYPLAWAHARALFQRKSSRVGWLMPLYWLTSQVTYAIWIADGDVYTAGRASSVVMTRRRARRWGRALGMAVTTLILFTVLVLAAALILPPFITTVFLSCLIGVLLLLLVALIVSAFPLAADPLYKPALRDLSAAGPVVVLHDLVRSPDDTPGTGTQLLAAMLRDPRFTSSTVIATAVTNDLADRYCAAGMRRAQPGSRVVIRDAVHSL